MKMDIVLDAGVENIEQDGEVFTITGPIGISIFNS